MLNTVYQLVAPRKFEVTYENIALQADRIIAIEDGGITRDEVIRG